MDGLKKTIIAVVVFLLLITGAAGCDQAVKEKKVKGAKRGGELNFFLLEPASIDPLNIQESEGFEVVSQLFDGLVAYDPETMEVKPAVAESWESDESGSVYTFKIKEGTKFHNGRELVAEDFKYAWRRVADPKSESGVSHHLAPIKGFSEMQSGDSTDLVGVKVKGKYELEVELEQPFVEFPIILGHPVFSPIPKEEVEKDPAAFAEKPVGNGPFQMASPWKHRQSIKIKRFDDYYGKSAFLDAVNFKIFADKDTGFLEFKAGGLDFTQIPLGQVGATEEEFGKKALVGEAQQSIDFIGFNLKSKIFKGNKDLRQAIDIALDKAGMAEAIYEGTRIPASGLVPPLNKGEKTGKPAGKPNIGRAKQLMKKAGYSGKKQVEIKLAFIAGESDVEELAQAIQADLAEIGVKVKVDGLESGAFFDALFEGKLEMFVGNWVADYPTADSFLYTLFFSQSENNVFGYDDESVDELLSQARQTVDSKKRDNLYKKVEREIIKDAPVAPLFFSGSSSLVGKNVEGLILNDQDSVALERVWLKE